MRMLLRTVVLLGLLYGTAAWADQVTLTNGDRLTGTILELDAEKLRLKTEWLGEVTIPRTAVASLVTDEARAITLPGDRVVEGTVSLQDGQAVIQGDKPRMAIPETDLKAMRTREAQANYEESLHPGWFDNWRMGIDVALSARGGGGTTSLSVGLDGVRRTQNDELTLGFHSFTEKEKEGTVVNDDKLRASVLYARDLSERTYYFGASDFDYDALQNLNLRWVLGGGLGWRLKQTQRVAFDLFGGGGIDQEYFQDEPVRRSGEAMVGEDLKWQITPRTYFQERIGIYPNLSNPGEYRMLVSSKLEVRINTWLSWVLTYSNHYLSDPPPETKKNDNLLTSGLHLSFGKTGEGFRLRR